MKPYTIYDASSNELRDARLTIIELIQQGKANQSDRDFLRQVEWELHRRWQQNPNLYYDLEND